MGMQTYFAAQKTVRIRLDRCSVAQLSYLDWLSRKVFRNTSWLIDFCHRAGAPRRIICRSTFLLHLRCQDDVLAFLRCRRGRLLIVHTKAFTTSLIFSETASIRLLHGE